VTIAVKMTGPPVTTTVELALVTVKPPETGVETGSEKVSVKGIGLRLVGDTGVVTTTVGVKLSVALATRVVAVVVTAKEALLEDGLPVMDPAVTRMTASGECA
jgi:hypothetical protein